MSGDAKISLLEELESLLSRQLVLAGRGELTKVEMLMEKTDCLIREAAEAGLFEMSQFEARRDRVARLCRDLHLTLSAEKSGIGEELRLVRTNRRALRVYGDNM